MGLGDIELDWVTHSFEVAGDPTPHLEHEWLVTNGTGAYAMGSVLGANTRRYHGLLIAATRPPVGRILALNQVLERLELRREDDPAATAALEFTSCVFRDDKGRRVFAPRGHTMLEAFDRGLTICWTYRWGGITVERELFLHWQEQAATLRYLVTGLDEAHSQARLSLAPMITLRDFHSLARAHGHPGFEVTGRGENALVWLGANAVSFHCPGATFEPGADWWYNVFYPAEAERGQDATEDLHVPGRFILDLSSDHEHEITLTVALGEKVAEPVTDTDARAAHLSDHLAKVQVGPVPGFATPAVRKSVAQAMAIAADDFVVGRTVRGEPLSTILAGYPWFADWGRDTFIALPGLLLTTGRFADASKVLQAYAAAIKDGLVPNRFDDYDASAAHYNTVDASLWFVHAAMQYVQASGDQDAWRKWLADAACSIIENYLTGTPAVGDTPADDHHIQALIRADDDGLITAGDWSTQLTWMDAACCGQVFTARPGKAVEINALWHNALLGLAEALPESHAKQAKRYKALATKVKKSFGAVFTRPDNLGLYDHVYTSPDGHTHTDFSIRPNQILAVSLPHSPLNKSVAQKVFATVRDRLLTPFGLRTLPAHDPHYHPFYRGDQYQRDRAYHQGTIWAWLIGPYAEAALRLGGFSADARTEAGQAIAPLVEQLMGDELGQLHEIYEADRMPGGIHRPVGTIAQAWSIAEVFRILSMLHER